MTESRTVVLDAPSNLGLRPPETGSVPGCYKLPWALRDRGLLEVLGAWDGGSLVPPRYRAGWAPGDGVRNAEQIAAFSIQLANRLQSILVAGARPLVLGGDCSILLGNLLALKRMGRHGLVFLDGHSDFRHPGNAAAVGAAAGEDLAIVTGWGDPRLTDLEHLGPYIRHVDVYVAGVRPADEYLDELASTGIRAATSREMLDLEPERASAEILETVTRATQGFWVHLDVDVVDATEMHAVDCPEPDGIGFTDLARLLSRLVASPRFVGMEVTIYDPDLDPGGACAERLVDCLARAFTGSVG